MINAKKISRNISLIENKIKGFEELLITGNSENIAPIIGITGAPGSGKSTLTDKLIEHIVSQNKTVAILCVDPTSPFNMGAILGDRIRMNRWYTHPSVYIRSLASRKALGGLSPMLIEISEYLKFEEFDFIIVETVGVGQSEIEISGLADATILVLVPEGGDEIQTMKSGVMEIADVFVINKADRPGADVFQKNLLYKLSPNSDKNEIKPVIKTIAEEGKGIDELYKLILEKLKSKNISEKKYWLLAEKVYKLIAEKKMAEIDLNELYKKIKKEFEQNKNFNLYLFSKEYQS